MIKVVLVTILFFISNLQAFNIENYDIMKELNHKISPTFRQLEDPKYLAGVISRLNEAIEKEPKNIKAYSLRNLYVFLLWDAYPNSLKRHVSLLGMKYSIETSKKFPNHPDGWLNRAIFLGIFSLEKGILNALKFIPDVKKLAEKAYKLDKRYYNAGAPLILGKLYYVTPGFPTSIGDMKKAEKYLNEAKTLVPNFPPTYVYLSNIEATKGNIDKAIGILNQIKEIKPKTWYQKFEKMKTLRIIPGLIRLYKSGNFNKFKYNLLTDPNRYPK